ncbi:MAG: lmo0937 family membrane protein [Candidatus Levybacteria bacterium]|nr:lmo0937 family membrane protein [Candidatus Levybacteria bacterium]
MGLLEIVAVILLVAWLGGFTLHIAGGLIHILLVLAFVLFLARFLRTAI